jgi:putative membrane protein
MTISTFQRAALAAAVAALFSGAAIAQQSDTQSSQPTPSGMARSSSAGKGDMSSLDRKDRKFMEKAAQGGVAEVELGQLASSRASNEQVKEFAERMVKDHGQANDELKQIAQSKGLDLPDAADRGTQRTAKSLEKKSGAEFDKAYMSGMVKDHQKDLKEFQNEAKNARDPEVKAYAEKGAQMIQEHLTEAQQVASSVGAKSGSKMSNLLHRDKSESGATESGATSGSSSSSQGG